MAATDGSRLATNSNFEADFAAEENNRWLAIKEDDIFLQNGLLRSIGLVPNPFLGDDKKVGKSSILIPDYELEGFVSADVKSLDELSRRISRICTKTPVALHTFHNYEFSILRKMWQWKAWNSKRNRISHITSAEAEPGTTISNVSDDNIRGNSQTSDSSLSSKLGLLLIVPLLKSQASQDPSLAVLTTNLLFDMLSNLPPMSLSKDIDKPMDALEDLIIQWMSESISFEVTGPTTAVALSCARGCLPSFLKSIQLLLSCNHLNVKLPVRDILNKLASMSIRVGKACAIHASNHISTWPYDDQINPPRKTAVPVTQEHNKISVAFDSGFLFVSGLRTKGLCKIGSGNEGTLQGYVYSVNADISASSNLAAVENFILIRDKHLDAQISFDFGVIFAETLRVDTLEKVGIVYIKLEEDLPGPYMTVGLSSDGRHFYLLRVQLRRINLDAPTATSSSSRPVEPPPLQVYLDIFEVIETDTQNAYYAKLKPRITLNREAVSREISFDPQPTGFIRIIHPNPPIQGPSTAEETFKHTTTLGIDLSSLMKSTIVCCGDYITLLVDYDGIGTTPNVPAQGVQVLLKHLSGFSPLLPKGRGVQLHIILGENRVSYSTEDLVDLPQSSSFIIGTGIQLGACYDSKSNTIWTSNGQYFDSWKNPAHRPNWYLDSQQLLCRNEYLLENCDLEIERVLNVLMMHVGTVASNFVAGDMVSNIGFQPECIDTVINITKLYGIQFDITQLSAIILLLQALVSQIKSDEGTEKLFSDIKDILCYLMDTSPILTSSWSNFDDPIYALYKEFGYLYSMLFECISTKEDTERLFQELDFLPDTNNRHKECLDFVREIVYQQLMKQYRERHHFADKWIVNPSRIKTIIKASRELTLTILRAIDERHDGFILEMPISTVETQFLSAVTNYFLKTWTMRDLSRSEDVPTAIENLNALLITIIQNCTIIVNAASDFDSSDEGTVQESILSVEIALKSSLVGTALPQILLFFTSDAAKNTDLIDHLKGELLHLSVSLSNLAKKLNGLDPEFASLYARGEDWSSHFKKPSAWQVCRYIESDHPLKENSKLKETITIPNARRLYVKFDKRCCTHYEYDKFTIFTGSGTDAVHICSYGGSTTRAGNGVSLWPTDFVQLDGDTMSYTFEGRGGRDRNSSEATVWGFSFTVYPVYDTYQYSNYYAALSLPNDNVKLTSEDDPKETSFVNKITLCSLDALHSFVLTVFEGSEISESEETKIPTSFLSNHFLTSFDWLAVADSVGEPLTADVTKVVTKDVLSRLLTIANIRDLPKMRSSMTRLIKPGLLQRLFATACLRCLLHDKTNAELEAFNESLSSSIHPEIIQEIFHRVTVIIRKLVSLVDMQFRLTQEIQDIISKTKEYSDAFFNSSSFLESQIDIENLTTLLDIPLTGDGQKIIRDIYSFVDACVIDNTKAELIKAEELVKETHLKCLCMIAANRRGDEYRNVSVRNIKMSKQVVDSISHFVGSHLNHSDNSTMMAFFEAIKRREQKSEQQLEAIRLLGKFLHTSSPYSQLVLSSALLLQKFSFFQDSLSFTRFEKDIRESFGQVTKLIVKTAESFPLLHRYSVFLLCILPYTSADETSLVESGLLGLLDNLCALQISDSPSSTGEHQYSPSENFETIHIKSQTASLAWAAFQVLAARCSAWETPKFVDIAENIALPVQISKNVTNHLARASSFVAMSSCGTADESDGILHVNRTNSLSLTDSIQDVLLLLDSLRETRLGQTILRQSPCICRLLSLLQDPRLSPRLTHTILTLLHTALPLADNLDLSDMASTPMSMVKRSLVPGHGSSVYSAQDTNPHNLVANLLLSKLADFLICANQHPTSNTAGTKCKKYEFQPRMAVWIHKGTDLNRFSEILHILYDPAQSNELHPLLPSITDAETAFNLESKAKVLVDNGDIAQEKATTLARMGFLVSLEPLHVLPPLFRSNELPADTVALGSQPSSRSRQDTIDHIGKERNSELANFDPARTFLSGEVAESLAAEVIRLLHILLASSEVSTVVLSTPATPSEGSLIESCKDTETNKSATTLPGSPASSSNCKARSISKESLKWAASVEQALCGSLKVLPKLSSIGNPIGRPTPLDSYGYSARLAIASLAVLGSFTESIRADAEVWIGPDIMMQNFKDNNLEEEGNWDFEPTAAKVISVNRNAGLATVEISENTNTQVPSRTLEVSLSRLTLRTSSYSDSKVLEILSWETRQDICRYLRALFTPSSSVTSSHCVDHCPIKKQLPTLSQIFSTATSASLNGTGSSSEAKTLAHGMTVVRLVAEIRTRAAQVLSIWLQNREFVDLFLGHPTIAQAEGLTEPLGVPECLGALNVLKRLALQTSPSHRLGSLQAQVTRLRLLYRDSTKPPKVVQSNSTSNFTNLHWDFMRQTTAIRNCAFRNNFTGVTFAGEPSSGAGNPRGVLLFATKTVPTSGFYFELQILSTGESTNESSLSFSFGLLPIGTETRRDSNSSGAWQYPIGGIMFHSTGRIVHYVGTSLLSWKSEKIEEYTVQIGDTIGMGWEPVPVQDISSAHSDPLNPTPIIRARHTATPHPPPTTGQRIVRARISIADANTRLAQSSQAGPEAGPSAPAVIVTTASSPRKGFVFLTLNGQRLPNTMENVDAELWPCAHLQRTSVSIDSNFGAKPFMYAAGRKPSVEMPEIGPNSVANQVNRFFASAQSNSPGPSGTGTLRRISESLQDLGVHFGNLTFYPLLEDEDDDDDDESEISDADAGSGSDTLSEDDSPVSSLTHISDEELTNEIPEFEFDQDPDPDPDPDPDMPAAVHNHAVISPTIFRAEEIIISSNPRNPNGTTMRQNVQRGGNIGTSKVVNVPKEPIPLEQDRTANSKPENKDYASACLLDYHLAPSTSFDIRVFSGPNRNFCPCTEKNDSDLDQYMNDDSDDVSPNQTGRRRSRVSDLGHFEGEDIHNLLVRAWEARVFPTIRRRFRNEAERRDGLEQIRGALQLGMIDIARQTVEYLYEEGNGIPRDLHFPTLEEIRLESARFTLERIHPGVTVSIRRNRDTEYESMLPKYGVPAMLRTFGLIGEVLDVDMVHELVLVETYVETEGLLLRFWYPLKDLEKPTNVVKPQLNSTTVNMLKLHSNLVDLESMLCHTYCRQAFLQILDEISACRSHDSLKLYETHNPDDLSFGLTSLFQDLDLENLQIRSDDNFADIPNNGDLLTRNLECGMPSMEFLTDSGNPSCVFYKDSKRLSRDLKCTIYKALSQGEDYVNELTNQICKVLKETPNSFITDTVPLDKEGPISVSLPGVAFTAICFSGLQTEKNITSIRNIAQPCVHLYGYNGGDSKKYPIGCFPVQPLQTLHKETSIARAGNISSSIGSTGANKNTNFVPLPHVLVPTNKIFCTITNTAMKENFLEVQGIPAQFPLALLYSQLLIDLAKENEAISRSNILNLICILTNFLERITLLPLLKEWIFAIVSEATNLLKNDIALMHEFYLAHSSVIYGLFRELVVNARAEINGHGARGILAAPKSIRVTNAQTTLNTVVQAGPSRPNRIIRPTTSTQVVAPNKIRSIIAAVCTLVQSDTLTKAKSNDLIGRLLEFPVLSSYLQMLTELCMTLFYAVQLFATAESTPVSSTDPSPIQTPQRKTSSIAQAATPTTGSLTVSRYLTTSSPAISTNAKKDKFVRIGKQGSKVHFTTPAAAAANQRVLKQRGPLSSDLQTKMVDVLCEIKNDQPSWFSSAYLTCQILKSIVWRENSSPNLAVLSSFMVEATSALQTVTNHSRLIVLCGAPDNIHEMPLETSLIRALNETGGIVGHEIWISENSVDVVVEIHSAQKTDQAIGILKRNQTWYPIEDFVLYPAVAVHSVNENLETGDSRGDQVLKTYLNQKLYDPPDQDKFCSKVEDIISHIFTTCFIANAGFFSEIEVLEAGTIFLEEKHLLNTVEGNLMGKFIAAGKPAGSDCKEFLKIILRKFGHHKEKPTLDTEDVVDPPACAVIARTSQTKFKSKLKDDKSLKKSKEGSGNPCENFTLTLEGFSQWCAQLGKDNVCALWRALFAAGYDIRFDRTWISETSAMISLMTSGDWTKEQDTALVLYIDRLAETLRVPPQFIHPHEIYLEESHYSNPAYTALRDVPLERVRARCAILQFLNLLVSKKILPYVPLHLGRSKKFSTAALLHDAQHILFYHLKDEFLYKVLQFSSLRSDDVPAPEVFLDPLQEIDVSSADKGERTMFSTALTQLHAIQSAFFCVTPSTGGDPPLPIVVKFIGEEVHGLIGSFRHFLSNAVEEVKSSPLQLLIKCPSSDAGRNKDSLIIRPGPLTLGEEKLLSFFGQFIGLCIRADAPISCSLLSTTWRSFVASTNDSDYTMDHLQEVDVLTSSFLNQLQSVESAEDFKTVLEQTDHPAFTYMSMDRKALVSLCPGGNKLSLSWETREEFVRLVKQLRKKEIESLNRTTAILGGLATLLPMPVVFNLFTPRHFESRVCGSPDINLPLLKAHTHYQVGICETDLHILFFWAALESMTPDELKDFIKFASNQERLPSTCPCQNQYNPGGVNMNNMLHVPPFPMKIAPIDIPPGVSQDYINKRTIRAETCLFLIRLPPYSSYQVTRQQLLFACNSRDDPLSG